MYQTFYLIQASERIQNLGFSKGNYLGWDSSTGDGDGPYDERVWRGRPTQDIQRARWFQAESEAIAVLDQCRYPGMDKFKVIRLYLTIGM